MRAGSVNDPPGADTLASAIEEAVNQARAEVGDEGLREDPAKGGKVLFVGIAQGILRYLKDHESDFKPETNRVVLDIPDSEL